MGGESPDYFFICLISAWIIISVLSNICVLLVIILNNKMQTVTTIYMCNLAINDIILAAFALPQNVHDLSHYEDYHEGEVTLTHTI